MQRRPNPQPSVTVRRATIDDFDVVLALHAELQPNDPVADPAVAASVFAEIIEHTSHDFVLLVDDVGGDIIGSIYLNIIPNLTRAARPYAVIENVIITSRRRGEKLGKQLMEAALDRARAADCYKVMLLTGSSNPDTHAFYRACGFDGDAKQGYLIRW